MQRNAGIERGVGRASRHHLVFNASEACPDVAVAPEIAAFPGDGPLLLLVASLRAQKRVDVFLRALPSVLEAVPTARAAIIGNGPESASLRALASELGLADDERLMMAPFQGPAARYLKAADVYVLSSGWESLPIGVLEALACGVPQVVANVGGVAEAIGNDTGVLVGSGRPSGARSSDRRTDPRSGASSADVRSFRIRHAERFALDRMVRETVAVYESAIKARR